MRAAVLSTSRVVRSKDTRVYTPGQQLAIFRRSQSRMTNRGRPGKKDEAPAPLYLQERAPPYCHTCGRVISNVTDLQICPKTDYTQARLVSIRTRS